MTQFHGSITARHARPDATPVAAALARAFAASGAESTGQRRTRGGWVQLDAKMDPADLWSDERGFAVVHGAPRVTRNAAFAAAVRDHGLARACALEYAAHGPSFLSALQGPFALAIHRGDDDRTLLAADKLGVYTLYYSVSDAELAFSNE